jgi:hypothetical protein
MQIRYTQKAHGGIFDQSRARTALQQARLALIAHIFAFLALLCLDPPTSVPSVILSALKVAISICHRGVGSDRVEKDVGGPRQTSD